MNHYKKICWGCGLRISTLKKCTKCKTAHYCGKECQIKNWAVHSGVCEGYQADNSINTSNDISEWLEDMIDAAVDFGHVTADQMTRGEELIDILDPVDGGIDEATLGERQEAIDLALHLSYYIHDLKQHEISKDGSLKFGLEFHPEDLLNSLQKKIKHGVEMMDDVLSTATVISSGADEISESVYGEWSSSEDTSYDTFSDDEGMEELGEIGIEYTQEEINELNKPTLLALDQFNVMLSTARDTADELWDAIGKSERTGCPVNIAAIQDASDMLLHCSSSIETHNSLELIGGSAGRRAGRARRRAARKARRQRMKAKRGQRRAKRKVTRQRRKDKRKVNRQRRKAERKDRTAARRRKRDDRKAKRRQKKARRKSDRVDKRRVKKEKRARKTEIRGKKKSDRILRRSEKRERRRERAEIRSTEKRTSRARKSADRNERKRQRVKERSDKIFTDRGGRVPEGNSYSDDYDRFFTGKDAERRLDDREYEIRMEKLDRRIASDKQRLAAADDKLEELKQLMARRDGESDREFKRRMALIEKKKDKINQLNRARDERIRDIRDTRDLARDDYNEIVSSNFNPTKVESLYSDTKRFVFGDGSSVSTNSPSLIAPDHPIYLDSVKELDAEYTKAADEIKALHERIRVAKQGKYETALEYNRRLNRMSEEEYDMKVVQERRLYAVKKAQAYITNPTVEYNPPRKSGLLPWLGITSQLDKADSERAFKMMDIIEMQLECKAIIKDILFK